MSDVFTISSVTTYDEQRDAITVRAFQSRFADNEPVTEAESDVRVVIRLSSETASIEVDTAEFHDFSFGPAILNAFARAWQDAHDKQNPGDSPALTQLESFTVTY